MTTATALPYGGAYQTIDDPDAAHTLCQSDGTPWPLVLVTKAGAIGAESATTIMELLIPQYANLGEGKQADNRALLLRWQLAAERADMTQSSICANLEAQGLFDPAVEDEQTLTMLFTSRLNGPIEAPTWDHPTVPLVLIWTDYAPYAALDPPVSKYQPIIWLDPSTEMTLLRSLDQIGLIQMHTNDA